VEERVALSHVGFLGGEIEIGFDIAQHAGEFLVGGDNFLGGFALLKNFLGFFLVLPEVGIRGFFF
jgi:hypothetical protein